MKTSKKRIDLMHLYFDKKAGEKCGNCCNLVTIHMNERVVRKCRAYGITYSSATDWAKKHEACGLFNKPVSCPMISEHAKRMFRRIGINVDDDPRQTTLLSQKGRNDHGL